MQIRNYWEPESHTTETPAPADPPPDFGDAAAADRQDELDEWLAEVGAREWESAQSRPTLADSPESTHGIYTRRAGGEWKMRAGGSEKLMRQVEAGWREIIAATGGGIEVELRTLESEEEA